MTEQDRMANALAAALAAMRTDELVQDQPPGAPGRRDRLRAIIKVTAEAWGVERMELTMAMARASTRGGRPQ